MRVKYIDTICTNKMHAIFNASLLAMLINLYSDIIFSGEKRNMSDVINILKENHIDVKNVRKRNLYLITTHSGIRAFLTFCLSFFYNLYFIISSRKNDLLVFNYNNLFSVRSINFFNKFFNRNILIFCHGEMEFLISDTKQYGLLNTILTYFGKNFFLNKQIKMHPKIKFVVMGDSILSNIKSVIPNNISKSFISIDHSYFFRRKENLELSFNNKKIKIGTVGTFSKIKGGEDFFKLYNLIGPDKVDFSITGRIFYESYIFDSMKIDIPKNKGKNMIPRNELEERIQKLDIILFFYSKTSYKLIASGAIMDAINMRKPILAIKNDYFEYIFRKFGRFGFLVNSVEEMATILKTIRKEDLLFDFDSIQKQMNISKITEQLKRNLVDINLF